MVQRVTAPKKAVKEMTMLQVIEEMLMEIPMQKVIMEMGKVWTAMEIIY